MDTNEFDDIDMTTSLNKIGLGGGCHWCTEGVFNSLLGVSHVDQGWIASNGTNDDFSEAIEVIYDPGVITLADLIEIHLYTHASTSNHSMRGKYRSAIYTYTDKQSAQSTDILNALKVNFDKRLVTKIYPFEQFKENKIEFKDYYYSGPNRPFCETYIQPKLMLLLARFKGHVDQDKISFLNEEK
ncbi:MAG: peptide-methionine (S)-S-oxide reductase [Alphaproteobacteria bacterium]|jgi:peptide-methionine (S)-S-oxide reductase